MSPAIDPPHPPRFSAWLFRRLFAGGGSETNMDDMEEMFQDIAAASGLRPARLWYRRQLLRSLPHRFLGVFLLDLPIFIISLKVMIRSLRSRKTFAFLSLLALTLGLTCFFLVFLYVRYESTYDSFHPEAERLYRLILEDPPGGERWKIPGPGPGSLDSAVAEVEATTRTFNAFNPMVKSGGAKYETVGYFVDEGFFRLFRFPLRRGAETSLIEPGNVALTESAARRIFGDKDPVGRVLDFVIRGEPCRLTVSAVMADPPVNTHLNFDLLISASTTGILPGYRGLLASQNDRFPRIYVRLRSRASRRIAEESIASYLDQPRGPGGSVAGLRATLQPISDVHLRPDGKNDSAVRALRLFSGLGLLVLFVSILNHVNLATSWAGARRQEIGIRKTVGARRLQLVRQFIGEAVSLTAAAFLATAATVVIVLPAFGRLVERDLRFADWIRPAGLLEVAAIVLLVGFAAGFYPAVLLSSFRPARILKNSGLAGAPTSGLRNALVTIQFGAAVVLIIAALFINGQVRFIRNRNPGFEKASIVEIWILPERGSLLKQRLLQNPAVTGVTMASNVISLSSRAALDLRGRGLSFRHDSEGEAIDIDAFHLAFDADFLSIFGIEILSGRDFSPSRDESASVLVNETLSRRLGPGPPLGKTVRYSDRDYTVIGVVRDFHFQPFHAEIRPSFFTMAFGDVVLLYARFDGISPGQALAVVRAAADEAMPEELHAPVLLEDRLAGLYKPEYRQASLMTAVSILAVVITGLGLFGLAVFTVERRTREIGIRKVLGARTGQLLFLLSSGFLRILATASVLGWPAAYFFAAKWMANFAYHIPVRAGTFLAAGGGMLALTLLVAATQVVRITRIDPVRTLKHE